MLLLLLGLIVYYICLLRHMKTKFILLKTRFNYIAYDLLIPEITSYIIHINVVNSLGGSI